MSTAFSGVELAARICAEPAPVLLIDSAAILNILEAPIDTQVQQSIPSVAASLVELATQDPPGVWLVIADVVATEITKNRGGILQKLKSNLKKLQDGVARVQNVQRQVFGPNVPAAPWSSITNFADDLDNALTAFLGAAHPLNEQSGCLNLAYQRMTQGRLPSRMGQNLINDCVIFEEYLELLRLLREFGFADPAFFVSPNTKDYGLVKHGGYLEIREDLSQYQAVYTMDLAHVRSRMDS